MSLKLEDLSESALEGVAETLEQLAATIRDYLASEYCGCQNSDCDQIADALRGEPDLELIVTTTARVIHSEKINW